MSKDTAFARRVFRLAGIYGLLIISPQFFLEKRIGADLPPAITHPEYFYGFLGVVLVWQIVFLLIATDLIRFRPLMIPSILEKVVFGAVAVVLYMQGRLDGVVLGFAMFDQIFAVLFFLSYLKTKPADSEIRPGS